MPLYLYTSGLLSSPNFYISAELEAHRDEYYERLLAVSRDGDWTGWCAFFLSTLTRQAEANQEKACGILKLYQETKAWIVGATHSQHALRALDYFFDRAVFRTSDFVARGGVPRPTANRIIRIVRDEGLLREIQPARGRRPATLAFPALLNIAEGREVF